MCIDNQKVAIVVGDFVTAVKIMRSKRKTWMCLTVLAIGQCAFCWETRFAEERQNLLVSGKKDSLVLLLYQEIINKATLKFELFFS